MPSEKRPHSPLLLNRLIEVIDKIFNLYIGQILLK